jgi:C4-dicarboxylate-specific signal transduction histidine kinase
MSRGQQQDLRSSQLSFIGKVLSAFSHELNNHLAVIKESAGLMGDIIAMGKTSARQGERRSLATLQSIEAQVGKTSGLCKYLGRFAHRMDGPSSMFDINEIIEELIALMNRTARQRGVTLERDFDRSVPLLSSDPLCLQFVMFSLAEEMMDGLERKGCIVFRTACSSGAVTLEIIPRGERLPSPGESAGDAHELLGDTVKELGGVLSLHGRDGAASITLPV